MGQRPRPLSPAGSPAALFGFELRALRHQAGLSQAALGRLIHVSGDLIGKIEKAERRPPPDVIRRLDDALEAGGALMWGASGLAAVLVGAGSASDPTPVAGPVSGEVVVGLRAVVDGYRRIDHSLGSAGVMTSLLASIDLAQSLRPATPSNLRGSLVSLLAEAHQLAGWMYFDSGALGAAQRAFLLARELAVEAEHPALVAYVMGPSHGFALTYAGWAKRGLELTREALRWAERSGNQRLVAFVLAIAARSHARLGDEVSCGRDLEASRVALDRHDPSASDPTWLGVFDHAALDGHRGSCLLDLGYAGKAIEALAEQDAAAPGHFVRNRVIWLLDRTEALAQLGEVEEACATAELALAAAAGTSSSRLRCRLHAASAALAGVDLPQVAALRDQISAVPRV